MSLALVPIGVESMNNRMEPNIQFPNLDMIAIAIATATVSVNDCLRTTVSERRVRTMVVSERLSLNRCA